MRAVTILFWMNFVFMVLQLVLAVAFLGFCIYVNPWFALAGLPIIGIIRMTNNRTKELDEKRDAYLKSAKVVPVTTIGIEGLKEEFDRLKTEIVGNTSVGLWIDRGDVTISARALWADGSLMVIISAGAASLWLRDKDQGAAILAHELCHIAMEDPSRAHKARILSQNYEALFGIVGFAVVGGILTVGTDFLATWLLVGVGVPLFFVLNFARGHQAESEFTADLCAATFGSYQAVITLLKSGELIDSRPLYRRLAFFKITAKHRLRRLEYLVARFEKTYGQEVVQP